MSGSTGRAAVVAVDGGNSKADVVLVGANGDLLAAVRGPTVSHQAVGIEEGMNRLARLVGQAATETGIAATPVAEQGVYSLAGADYAADVHLLERAIATKGLAAREVVINDSFGALRAGTDRGWGVVLICGEGINAAAVAPDGRSARFPAVGDVAGDWGGGSTIGMEGLSAAIRGRDGRGARTSLERLVPAHFGLKRPAAVTRAVHTGRIPYRRISQLSPIVFAAAKDGDAVARSIVERLADELVAMAGALIRRLRLRRLDVEIVLAGGVFRTDDQAFFDSIERGIRAIAPQARLVRLSAAPVTGAALLGLDMVVGRPVEPDLARRLREAVGRSTKEMAGP